MSKLDSEMMYGIGPFGISYICAKNGLNDLIYSSWTRYLMNNARFENDN
jgi:hypothetical protein